MTLIRAGIDVLRSACGTLTGVAFPAVCGAPTGEINLHDIRPENLPDAERLGFRDVAVLGVAPDIVATGFMETECRDQ
ncbi:MAG TPA: hypothetical protein VKA43_08930 [Gammaproteobacteria bacterium]|nr:hypothetical protein [Gammaproteobacteria bacterium]